ncbi:ArpU family phage packaging/lysis transcriptional regulator [Paenibacillus campi]|uniref:ArpU family phage packaging/lysis transcriptional regulator n=1 Tax=Paenibacillus campi TaxID=3106031 RepID=UPI002AFF503F|nr:ArpU family phage packaging/lysis transcriptional regulator [Paenibacillus sp. SGZ-1014]
MNPMISLPELDRRQTRTAVEAVFEKYRIYKTITFEVRETSVTASYEARMHRPTHMTSDPTAGAAIYNVDTPAARRAYCERIEAIVARLGEREQLLIRERYLKQDDVFDYKVYNYLFDPPISKDTYVKIRSKAFYKLALAFADNSMIHLDELAPAKKRVRRTDMSCSSFANR